MFWTILVILGTFWTPALSGERFVYDLETRLQVASGGSSSDGASSGGKTSRFSLRASLDVARIWSRDQDTLIRFKMSNVSLHFSRNNDDVDVVSRPEAEGQFFVKYRKCKPELILSPAEEDVSRTNLYRGVASLFQFESSSWQGVERGASGKMLSKYGVDRHGVHVKRVSCDAAGLGCHEVRGEANAFAATWKRFVEGRYVLLPQSEGAPYFCAVPDAAGAVYEVIETAQVREEVTSRPNLHREMEAAVVAEQIVRLREQTGFSEELQAEDLESAIHQVLSSMSMKHSMKDIEGQVSDHFSDALASSKKTTAPQKLKTTFQKVKKVLGNKYLATMEAVKAFLLLRQMISSANLTQKDLEFLLKDPQFKDIGLQVMDILGSSRNAEGHSLALDSYGDPSRTKNPELCERYLWALAQVNDPPEAVSSALMDIVKQGNISNRKLRETAILTLGSLHFKCRSEGTQASIEEWLLKAFDKCKDQTCLGIMARALKNTRSPSVAHKLLSASLLKTEKELKHLSHALEVASHIIEEVPPSTSGGGLKALQQFEPHLLEVILNHGQKTRAASIQLLLRLRPHLSTLVQLLSLEANGNNKLAHSVAKRLLQVSESDKYIAKMLRSLYDKGLVNWSVLSSSGGGFRSTIQRPLATSLSGNTTFLYDLEMDGMQLKKSDLQFKFSSPGQDPHAEMPPSTSQLLQIDCFGGGFASYFGGDPDGDGGQEPHAGMQLSVLGNGLRPFVFFRSTAELMDLYWSGAAEQKKSALSGNLVVQDVETSMVLGCGATVGSDTQGAISFDSSGKASVSIWSQAATTHVGNAGAYFSYHHVLSGFFDDNTIMSHSQELGTEVELNVDTDVKLGAETQLCIKMHQPDLKLRYKTVQMLPGVWNKHTQRSTFIPGRSVFLGHQISDLCSTMIKW